MSDEVVPYEVAGPVATNGHAPITRLCALDKLFIATGTVEVKAGTRSITLPIQAVDNEQVEALVARRPVPPTRRELNAGNVRFITNEADPKYLKELEDYQREYGYVYTLCALALDIVDSQGQIVWSADNSVHDLPAAKEVLRQMGLVDNQRATILNAALNLTRAVEEGQALD